MYPSSFQNKSLPDRALLCTSTLAIVVVSLQRVSIGTYSHYYNNLEYLSTDREFNDDRLYGYWFGGDKEVTIKFELPWLSTSGWRLLQSSVVWRFLFSCVYNNNRKMIIWWGRLWEKTWHIHNVTAEALGCFRENESAFSHFGQKSEFGTKPYGEKTLHHDDKICQFELKSEHLMHARMWVKRLKVQTFRLIIF